jgi:hypothetical protein
MSSSVISWTASILLKLAVWLMPRKRLHAGHAITGLVAPIGLFLGLRYVLLNRALDRSALGCALIAAPVLQTIAGLIGVVGFGAEPLLPGIFLLLIVLPILGIAHLMYLARPAASQPSDARLAAS